jgi:hypothetical protein
MTGEVAARCCIYCGSELVRKFNRSSDRRSGVRREGKKHFESRMYCDRSCQARGRTLTPDERRESVRLSNRTQYTKAQEREGTFGRPLAWRISALRRNYGITAEDYDRMLSEQGGACAVCGGGPRGNHKYLSVDHDHATGVVRGLLCTTCNPAIGMFKDDPALLRRAADYLESSR